MNTSPKVPSPALNNSTPIYTDNTWADRMATLAARYNDSQTCLTKLDELLASGSYTSNQMRRAEEDCVRCFGLFVTALVRSYKGDKSI